MEVVESNREVAMETRGKAKFETKSKMVDSQFTLSDKTVFNQLKQKKKHY